MISLVSSVTKTNFSAFQSEDFLVKLTSTISVYSIKNFAKDLARRTLCPAAFNKPVSKFANFSDSDLTLIRFSKLFFTSPSSKSIPLYSSYKFDGKGGGKVGFLDKEFDFPLKSAVAMKLIRSWFFEYRDNLENIDELVLQGGLGRHFQSSTDFVITHTIRHLAPTLGSAVELAPALMPLEVNFFKNLTTLSLKHLSISKIFNSEIHLPNLENIVLHNTSILEIPKPNQNLPKLKNITLINTGIAGIPDSFSATWNETTNCWDEKEKILED